MIDAITLVLGVLAIVAGVDAIIAHRRLAVVRRQYEEERGYCLHSDARVTELERHLDALNTAHANLQALYAERTRQMMAMSHPVIMRCVAWKRDASQY